MSRKQRRTLVRGGVATAIVLFVALCAVTSRRGPFDSVTVVRAQATPTPPAGVTLWPMVPTALEGFFGRPGDNPNSSRADIAGLTGHVACPGGFGCPAGSSAALTVVTNFENIHHDGGPCGITYWNPATNAFKWYGVSSGFTAGLDVNLSGPVTPVPLLPVEPIGFTATTFGPGDVWASVKTSATPLYVHFAGSDSFRRYFVGTGTVNGVTVDQASGMVWFTDEGAGVISQLDPATNMIKTWVVGGVPHYLTVDPLGRVYGTVHMAVVAADGLHPSGQDAIVRIDPSAAVSNVTSWPILTASGFTPVVSFDDTPDGIEFNGAIPGVWFVETMANTFGRLDVTPESPAEMFEITKAAINQPQQIASSGGGAVEQAFSTEANGNAVDVITPGPGVGVTPIVTTVTPITITTIPVDDVIAPLTAIITPETHTVPGVDPPGITHFAPMPDPTTGGGFVLAGANDPSGMTGVAAAATIFGSYLSFSGGQNSAVFQFTSEAIIAPTPTPTPSPTPTPNPAPAGKVTGGGAIASTPTVSGLNNKDTFGFIASRKTDGGPVKCEGEYINHNTGEKVHIVSCDFLFFPDSQTATFGGSTLGSCTNNGVPCSFSITVQDKGEPGVKKGDTYDISGVVIVSQSGPLIAGNIQIHKNP